MSHYLTHLRCVTCGREFLPGPGHTTCPNCGPLLGTLEVLYDYNAAARKLSRRSLADHRRYDMWRYRPLLPVENSDSIPPLTVGWTPSYRAERLADDLKLGAVWVKDDGRNPTASLKDRASAVAVANALETGAGTVTAASTGNAAASFSAFTAVAGLQTVIFLPRSAPPAKLAQLLVYGANVVQVRGSYDQAFDLCCQVAQKWGWYNRSTAVNPYLGEGKKTAAFELCEQLNWDVPDYVFVGVGDGCILQGLWKGFKEFHILGLINRPPKMIGVQARGASPLVRAWEAGARRTVPAEAQTLADSIAVGKPRDQIKCLQAIRESGGRMIAVEDGEILHAIRQTASTTGIMAEPAGAVALAGVARMAKSGTLGRRDRVAVMVTGNGLKDIDSVRKAADMEPVCVKASLESVEACLNDLTNKA
jgi:threonine synthase